MNIKTALLFIILPFLSISQKFSRNTFEYTELQSENFEVCDDNINLNLEKSLTAIKQNSSKFAVTNAEDIYKVNKECYAVYDVYGYALFRNGKWFEGLEIIEAGINKFGSVPVLIRRKADMSIEMAQYGTGRKHIDGNAVFKANSVEYNEKKFIKENYKSALLDLQYLVDTYHKSEDIMQLGRVYQYLKKYDESTEAYSQLINDEEYKFDAIFNIGANYMADKKLDEAEAEFNKLLVENPKSGIVYGRLSKIYEKQKESNKAYEYNRRAVYYSNMPPFSDMDYSNSNFNKLLLFGTNESKASKKIEKLNQIFEDKPQDFTIDICLMILKLHANHGNGVEERATEILSTIGQPAIEKVNKLFQLDVATCTITNLADVMATVKDSSSWVLMKAYLPKIANMPMTLIPPNLPAKMIKFNEDEGLREILIVVKPLLTKKKDSSASFFSGFGQYVYYSPLKELDQSKVINTAKELDYSDEEVSLLLEKIK